MGGSFCCYANKKSLRLLTPESGNKFDELCLSYPLVIVQVGLISDFGNIVTNSHDQNSHINLRFLRMEVPPVKSLVFLWDKRTWLS